ncbi:hypothetical protein [Streptomyces sp. NPDC049590]|uniref:hypothetical protein n=1 Tax=Streptomyces sp. NPDC049590 TaxID=3154834 RepID=UPI003449204E
MSKREKQVAVFAAALIGAAVLQKVASREAKTLGVSAGTLAVLSWAALRLV